MAAQKHETAPESMAPVEKGAVRRRGLIAGAAALAAGLLATRMGSEAVDAADNSPILQGSANDAANTASTRTTLTAPTTAVVFRAMQAAVATPDTTTDALQGFATNPAAPPGTVNNSGVHGRNDALGGIGTTGVATNGTGVYGQSNAGTGVGAVSTSGNAVYASSASGVGVYGLTSTGLYGIVGSSGTVQGSAGLLGVANGPNAVGFGTVTAGGATFAGYFNGTTVVQGAFAVTGSKSAAVKDAAGDYRLMYSVESPEAWFEDFGTGTLVNGKATVKLDPQFVQHIHTDQYHVFLAGRDDHLHLIAKGVSAGGFTVEADAALAALKGKTAADLAGTFSWRVVAKRNDIKGERLAKFTMPPTLTAPAPHAANSGVLPLPKLK